MDWVVDVGGLVSVLIVCLAWTLWKTFVLAVWPWYSSWRFLLQRFDPVPLVGYYAWVAWALIVVARVYRREVSARGFLLGVALAAPLAAGLYPLLGSPELIILVLNAVTFSVFGGVVEEVVYRGLLLDALEERVGTWKAILLQAVAFGLSHPWSLGAMLAATMLGVPMGVLRRKAGLSSCIAFHWAINIVSHA